MDPIDESVQIRRSISMPVKPRYIEPKTLVRSEERETVYDKDYYPESPRFERRKRSMAADNETNDGLSKSADELPYSTGWAGSTIELYTDPQRKGSEFDSMYSRKQTCRIIQKNGRENVNFRRVPEKSWRYMRDFVTTLIELDWKYMLTVFLGSYFFTWFFFAALCYMVAYSHGDLLFDEVTGDRLGEGNAPCIVGVRNFASMLIYSIETQTTIGFGAKYPSEECPETILLFVMQIICSIAIEGGMISIIYAKTARPAKQLTKLKFSDKAVICYRDGKLCLLFRVCDPRQQQSIHSKIRVYVIADRPTQEDEVIKTHTELKLENNGCQLIMWPEIVCHVIDAKSPLREYTNAKELNAAQFELYVSIVGVSSATAHITEARTSYMPREIFWGQRFINIVNYDMPNERYVIDYSNFNTTISMDMTKDKDNV